MVRAADNVTWTQSSNDENTWTGKCTLCGEAFGKVYFGDDNRKRFSDHKSQQARRHFAKCGNYEIELEEMRAKLAEAERLRDVAEEDRRAKEKDTQAKLAEMQAKLAEMESKLTEAERLRNLADEDRRAKDHALKLADEERRAKDYVIKEKDEAFMSVSQEAAAANREAATAFIRGQDQSMRTVVDAVMGHYRLPPPTPETTAGLLAILPAPKSPPRLQPSSQVVVDEDFDVQTRPKRAKFAPQRLTH